jgi:hypothetical protein
MSKVGFEPTISVFELAKTFHPLDRAATVIGQSFVYSCSNFFQKDKDKVISHTWYRKYLGKVCGPIIEQGS